MKAFARVILQVFRRIKWAITYVPESDYFWEADVRTSGRASDEVRRRFKDEVA
jgi:hypothetical protein